MEEPNDKCSLHEFIQEERREKYKDITSKFAEHEILLGTILDRTTFWIVAGIFCGLVGWLFIQNIDLRDRLATIRSDYVQRSEFVDWKAERERRLSEVVERLQRDMDSKHPKKE